MCKGDDSADAGFLFTGNLTFNIREGDKRCSIEVGRLCTRTGDPFPFCELLILILSELLEICALTKQASLSAPKQKCDVTAGQQRGAICLQECRGVDHMAYIF